jgi:hypothetical protein
MEGRIFEPFDFPKLQEQAKAGQLDCLLALTADGQVTAYGPNEGDESIGQPQGYNQAITGPVMYAAYYKCINHRVACCYIDGNGNEKCKIVNPPREC